MKKIIKKIIPIKLKEFVKNLFPSIFSIHFPEKIKVMDKYINQYNFNIFIETGTFRGDTLYRLRNKFRNLYSIELSEYYYNFAQKRFRNIKNINLILGNSGKKLGELVKNINEPIFFWLDGHYSAGLTAKADKECPMIEEIDAIFENSKFKNLILIDDARLFDGTNDYPTFTFLKNYIQDKDSSYNIIKENDIIICESK